MVATSGDLFIGQVDPALHGDLDSLFTIDPFNEEPLHIVQSQLGFFSTGEDYRDSGGMDERWFKSAEGAWHFIKPSGEIFRWGGQSDLSASTFVVRVTPDAHANLNLIFNALQEDV